MFNFLKKIFRSKSYDRKAIKKLIIKKANKKPLSDTGVIISVYINVSGISNARAEQLVMEIMETAKISEDDRLEMGVKFVKQLYYPVSDTNSTDFSQRVEITLV